MKILHHDPLARDREGQAAEGRQGCMDMAEDLEKNETKAIAITETILGKWTDD